MNLTFMLAHVFTMSQSMSQLNQLSVERSLLAVLWNFISDPEQCVEDKHVVRIGIR
jgi:uncharacterized membrane protein